MPVFIGQRRQIRRHQIENMTHVTSRLRWARQILRLLSYCSSRIIFAFPKPLLPFVRHCCSTLYECITENPDTLPAKGKDVWKW